MHPPRDTPFERLARNTARRIDAYRRGWRRCTTCNTITRPDNNHGQAFGTAYCSRACEQEHWDENFF